MDPNAPVPRRRLKVGPHGIGLSVLEAGPADGRPVILLHGFPEFSGAWQAYFEPLAAAGLRVVAPDQRGYGWSDKPAGVKAYGLDVLAADIAGLAAALGFKTIALVGHDWGGIVAWWIAATMPELVERLVVLNAPHVPVTARFLRHHPGQAVRSWYVGAFQVPGLPERLLARNDFAVLRRSMTQSARPGTFSPEVLASFAAAWAQDGALTGMVNWYRALVRDPPRTPSRRISCPCRILWGRRDPFLDHRLAPASLALCDRGDIVWFEEAGHWLHHEVPQDICAALVRFLAAPGRA